MLSLVACGSNTDSSGIRIWYLGGSGSVMSEDKAPEELFADITDTINPTEIYDSLEITEKMLYGAYSLDNMEKDVKSVREDMPFEDVTFNNGTFSISKLPVSVCFGKDYVMGVLTGYNYGDYKNMTTAEVAILSFATEDDIGHVPCIYEVSGDKIVFQEIEQTSQSDEAFTYDLMGNTFEYNFSLRGPYLTLTKGEYSIELMSYCFTDNMESDRFSMSAYAQPDSPLIANLDCFSSSQGIWNYAMKRDGDYYSRSAYKLTDNGLFTIYLEDIDENGDTQVVVEQYVYIAQSDALGAFDDFRLILFDGSKEYYYTDDVVSREARSLKEGGNDISALTDKEIEEIAQKKSDLFDDLTEEFKAKGIDVTINRTTGEIAMDASVLFAGDSADITADGKALLDQFLTAYTSIIYNDKYDGFISKTMIEGHTAPLAGSAYESGLPLSTQRADNVKAYCLSPDNGVDTSRLATSLEAVGLSNSKPVYNAEGEVDTAACRRVSFRFLVNIEQQ